MIKKILILLALYNINALAHSPANTAAAALLRDPVYTAISHGDGALTSYLLSGNIDSAIKFNLHSTFTNDRINDRGVEDIKHSK